MEITNQYASNRLESFLDTTTLWIKIFKAHLTSHWHSSVWGKGPRGRLTTPTLAPGIVQLTFNPNIINPTCIIYIYTLYWLYYIYKIINPYIILYIYIYILYICSTSFTPALSRRRCCRLREARRWARAAARLSLPMPLRRRPNLATLGVEEPDILDGFLMEFTL